MSSKALITKEFIQQIFKEQNVLNFSIDCGTKPGDNYLSDIFRLHVNLERNQKESLGCDESCEKWLMVKFYPENEAKREFLDSVSLFATEYLIYKEFLPTLNALAKEAEKRKDGRSYGFNCAQFYGGNIVGTYLTTFDQGPWSKENLIVLEDVRVRPPGFQMLDRRRGIDLQHCLVTVQQLANLHALSWVYKRRNGLNYLVDKHPYLRDAMYRIENEAEWRPVVEGMNRNALKVIQEEFGETSDIFQRFSSLLSKDVLAIIRMFLSGEGVNEEEVEKLLRVKFQGDSTDSGEPWLVATHGDCWINNILFSKPSLDGDASKPLEAVLVDFQAFREACPTTDLAYFLYSSTGPSLRRNSIELILSSYFQRFVEICSNLNEDLPKEFTLHNLMRRWRRTRIYALLMSIQFITFIFKPYESTDDMKGDDDDEVIKTDEAKDIANAYSEVVRGVDLNVDWRNAIIQTVVMEYEDGIL